MEEKRAALKRLRVWQCVKVLLIFLGLFGIQMIAFMVCSVAYLVLYFMRKGTDNYMSSVDELSKMMMYDSDLLMFVSALSALLAMIWCGILYYRSTWRVEKNNYRAVFSPNNILGIIAVGVGGCIFFSVILSIISSLLPSAFNNYSQLMDNLTQGTPALSYLYVILIGPVSEELIFRGAMLDRFRIAFPLWLAIILQALLFGIYHMNVIQGTYAFFLGAVLGLICYKAGSIFASMIAHCLFNLTSFVLSEVKSDNVIWLLFFVSIVVFAAGIFYFLKVDEKQP